jgi:mono/diheme cytochrome c family protein
VTRTVLAGLALALTPPAGLANDELGRKVFMEVAQPPCALCHTLEAAGASGSIGPSLDELKPDKERVAQMVRQGAGAMPAFEGKLTPEQIEAVAGYVAKAAGK